MPSPAEWKDAWAELSEVCSLVKIGRMTEKKAGSGGEKKAGANRIRKRRRKQLLVMAEVTRRRIRKALMRATSITLALDESKYRKIVRFRCDVPSRCRDRSRWRGASGFSYSGVLGLLDCSKKHASDFEEDHAVTAVAHLDSFLTKFCTPLGPTPAQGRWGGRRGARPSTCDTDLKAHVMKTVRCIARPVEKEPRLPQPCLCSLCLRSLWRAFCSCIHFAFCCSLWRAFCSCIHPAFCCSIWRAFCSCIHSAFCCSLWRA